MVAITLALSTHVLAVIKLGYSILLLAVRKLYIVHVCGRHWPISYLFSASPPTPARPIEVSAQSTSITIGWSESECNGGHPVISYDIRYYPSSEYVSRITIQNIDPMRRNYTITELQSSTFYMFQVRVVSVYSRTSSYSPLISISTLSPGMS